VSASCQKARKRKKEIDKTRTKATEGKKDKENKKIYQV
jgi:hypothetical protein